MPSEVRFVNGESMTVRGALLILRVALGATFIIHGYPKLFPSGPAGFAGFLQNLGFPAPALFAWIVSIVEFGGGIAMISGLLVRYVGVLMTIEMLVTSTKVKMAHGVGFVGARGAGRETGFPLPPTRVGPAVLGRA